jgi:Domain of unknown function (DUF5666)
MFRSARQYQIVSDQAFLKSRSPWKDSAVITLPGLSVVVASLLVMPTKAPIVAQDGVSRWFGGSTMQVSPTTVATHATKGVVKSIDATSLVITRSARRAKEQTFAVDASTHQVGQVSVGATVEVRYRTQEGHRVATVVSVQEAKPQR